MRSACMHKQLVRGGHMSGQTQPLSRQLRPCTMRLCLASVHSELPAHSPPFDFQRCRAIHELLLGFQAGCVVLTSCLCMQADLCAADFATDRELTEICQFNLGDASFEEAAEALIVNGHGHLIMDRPLAIKWLQVGICLMD